MKISHSVKWILAGALIIPGLTGCSMFGGDSETPEVAATEENAEASTDAAAPQAEANENAEPIAGAEGTGINDAAVAQAAEAAAGPAGGAMPSNEIPPELLATNAAPAASDPVASPSTDPASAPMAASTGFSAPSGDMRVYFVKANEASLHNSPDASSQALGALKKGDPVLVKIEGNWANVVSRGWVELATLSMGPVARPRTAKSWN